MPELQREFAFLPPLRCGFSRAPCEANPHRLPLISGIARQ
jgi:hypothetical protein